MIITLKAKLKKPNKRKEILLENYCREFTECCNFYLKEIQRLRTTSRKRLHSELYQKAKKKFPEIATQNLQTALDKSIETARAFYRKKGKKTFPRFTNIFGAFRQDSVRIDKLNLGLNLIKGKRIWLPFEIRNEYKPLLEKSGRVEIKKVRKKWFAFITVQLNPEKKKAKKVLGLDLGIAKIATLSDSQGRINKFWRGEWIRWKHQYFEKIRAELQKNRKSLKKISGKERRWMRDINHKISREIVNIAIKEKANIAVENLIGIRSRLKLTKRTRKMIAHWSFRELLNFIEYKLRLAGLEMFSVNPRGTSITCPKCGFRHRRNRRSQSIFKCSRCGYELNADLVAARNIATLGERYILSPECGYASAVSGINPTS